MPDVLPAAVALTGSGLCLAGHVPGPVRRWGPHATALAVTLLMVGGPGPYPLLMGAAVTAGMCLFTRGPVAADLAVMAVVTAAMARLAQGRHDHHTGGHGLFALAVVLWLLARAGAVMQRALRPGAPCVGTRGGIGGIGGAMMALGMAAMLA
ncbi:hypothetical protein R6V09_16475 [Streptomyces sp. W16]|uniref:hypothetical protein n=1 Tax=Streptomyces sp. W16 TaxID=3076631 RepID=UPI00295C02AE|nr:hypothetical protein [Streptomyces sp. W16]MDV9171710.1 hypothetical protein [Streptomyces sp. W16]